MDSYIRFMTDGTGMLVNGRYLLLEPVGEGGMTRIWRGRDQVMDREVAVKELLLPPNLAADDRAELLAATVREAHATGRIDHPGVITIYDVVEDSGVPWIVMQFVRGPSLGSEIKRAGRLPWQRAAEIAEQVAGALAEAHAAGIVHRNLKPDNILLAGHRAIVTGFGAAQVADAAMKLTGMGAMIGAPGYMAPEQFDDRPVSPATDMWALGASLYCATEGSPPFNGSTLSATIGAILARPHGLPQHAGPLTGLIGSLLDKDPARRPDANAAARALVAFHAAPAAGPQPATGPLREFTGQIAGSPRDVIAPFGWPSVPSGPEPGITPFGWPSKPSSPEPPVVAGPRKRAMPRPPKAWAIAIAGISATAAVIAAVALLLPSSPKAHSSSSGTTATSGTMARSQATASSGSGASPGITASNPNAATPTTPSAAGSPAAAVGNKCSFVVGGPTSCDSTNPQVRLSVNFGNDTSGCSFVRNINWGDGTSSDDVIVQGGPAGPKFVTAHTYSTPGSYTIYFGGEVTQGDCNIVTPTLQFTFRSS
jgi:serine/threonine protein kinase